MERKKTQFQMLHRKMVKDQSMAEKVNTSGLSFYEGNESAATITPRLSKGKLNRLESYLG